MQLQKWVITNTNLFDYSRYSVTIKLKERPAQCETNVHDTVTGVAFTENYTCNWKRPCS